METEAETANIPVVQLGIGSPPSLLPPQGPKPLVFGGGAGWGTPNSCIVGAVAGVFELIQPPFTHAILTVDSAANRWFFPNFWEVKQVPALGLQPTLLTEYISPAAPDPTPFALKLKETNADVILYCGPSGPGTGVQEALRRMGWEGYYIHTGGEAIEAMMERVKDPKVLVLQGVSIPLAGLPEHEEIKAAADKYGITSWNSMVVMGWASGMTVAEILKQTGYPVTTEKLLEVMNDFNYSLKPLKWGVEWNSMDHAGPYAWQNWYWDPEKGTFLPLNWVRTDAAGLQVDDLGTKVLE